jgi:hypothetical protein
MPLYREGYAMIRSGTPVALALAVPLVLALTACVTPPSQEDVKALDYGACPRNYADKVKETFRGGLITRYSGEPVIWAPQQFWYKTPPLEGGRLLAGHLVLASANQFFGPQPTAGWQLYGFLFRNDELIYKLSPQQMESLRLKEAVGPFPKDERDWKEGHKTHDQRQMLIEYVPPGQSVQSWSELVSVQIVFDVRLDLDAERFVSLIMANHKSKQPGCQTVSHKVLGSTLTEVLYEQSLVGCAPLRDEYSIRKVIRGPRAMTEVSYARTSPLTDADKDKWQRIVGRTALMNECATTP